MSGVAVRRTIVVKVPIETAFDVFTGEIDSWWPRTHPIGKSDMTRIAVDGRVGGRCYTQRDWGHVLVWEPPNRFVFAWQITHAWENQSDLSRCSEVEVTFASLADGATRVEVEHRHFERHGAGGGAMRAAVDAPNGWTVVLAMFVARLSR